MAVRLGERRQAEGERATKEIYMGDAHPGRWAIRYELRCIDRCESHRSDNDTSHNQAEAGLRAYFIAHRPRNKTVTF